MFRQFASNASLVVRRSPKWQIARGRPRHLGGSWVDSHTKNINPAPLKEGIAYSALGDVPRDADGAVQLYDEWASTYDDTVDSWGWDCPFKMADLLKDLVPADANVLDLGCGTGMTGRALVEAGIVGDHFGMDISPGAVARAAKTGNYRGGTVAASLEESFPDVVKNRPKFDAVICVGVLLYVHDFEVFWEECANVLKPGGKLCVTQVDSAWMSDVDGIQTKLARLIAEGELLIESVSRPQPYMPNNPDPVESEKEIRYIVLSKAY